MPTNFSKIINLGGSDLEMCMPRVGKTNQVSSSFGLMQYNGSAPASISTAGAATYTAAQLLGGIIVRDPNGAGRTDTLPTAALLVAAVNAYGSGAQVGDLITFLVVNGADAAEAITVAAGSGGAFDANQTAASRTIAQNASKTIYVRLTNVTSGAEAYVIYA